MAPNQGFADQWPELADRLARSLSARGVSGCLQEDIVQETGLRLFAMWERVDQSRGAWPLALTIAKNLLWDEVNRRRKREVLGEIADQADPYDVEQAGIARVELGRINRVLPELSPNHRGILLNEVGVPSELVGNPRSIKMLRMRARRRLIALLDRASALGVAVVGSFRAIAWRVQRTARHENLVEGYGAIATLVAAAIVSSLIVASDAPAHAEEGSDVLAIDDVRSEVVAAARPLHSRASRNGAVRLPPVESRKPTRTHASQVDRYDVSFGEGGPASAEIKIEMVQERGTGTALPSASCDTQTTEREMSVTCRAEATAQDTTVRVRARVKTELQKLGV